MTEICIDVRPGANGPSLEDLARRLVWGASGTWLVPAYRCRAGEPAPDRIPDEHQAAEDDTVYDGPSQAPEVIQIAAQKGDAVYWCGLALPMPGAPVPRGAYLRRREEHAPGYRPILELTIGPAGLGLRFGASARPLFAPHHAAAAWTTAVDFARERLAETIADLRDAGAQVDLRGDPAPRILARLAADLGDPPLDVTPPTTFLGRTAPEPGPCHRCRHANQGTIDLEEDGLLACSLVGSKYGIDRPHCDAKVGDRFAFEPHDGANCTWGGGLGIVFDG